MNKIQKFLKKLSLRERIEIEKILNLIYHQKFQGLDIKKLKGRNDIYRVRKGQLRIIFLILEKGNIYLIDISKRNDTTYNL